MVFLHWIRCRRFLWRGALDRIKVLRMMQSRLPSSAASTFVIPPAALQTLQEVVTPSQLSTTSWLAVQSWAWTLDPAFLRSFLPYTFCTHVYCGPRMVDELGHVNNAKYLEIMEFARWHQLSFLGLGSFLSAKRIAFVVSDLSIAYVREVPPLRTVAVRTRILPATTSSSEASFDRRLYAEQEIWSEDGRVLHASALMSVALVGAVEYDTELQQRYATSTGVPGATSSAPPRATAATKRKRTPLVCLQALSAATGCDTVEELKQLFAAAQRKEKMEETVSVVSSSGPDSAACVQRYAALWRDWRNVVRRRIFVPPK